MNMYAKSSIITDLYLFPLNGTHEKTIGQQRAETIDVSTVQKVLSSMCD
jgi:hypothetical protein